VDIDQDARAEEHRQLTGHQHVCEVRALQTASEGEGQEIQRIGDQEDINRRTVIDIGLQA